jgi:hypothetical protein
MRDFFSGAFLWVAMGIAIAIIIAYLSSKNNTKERKM